MESALGWCMQQEMGTDEVPPGDWVVSWVCVGVAIAAASNSQVPRQTERRLKNQPEIKQVLQPAICAQRFAVGPAAVL